MCTTYHVFCFLFLFCFVFVFVCLFVCLFVFFIFFPASFFFSLLQGIRVALESRNLIWVPVLLTITVNKDVVERKNEHCTQDVTSKSTRFCYDIKLPLAFTCI